MPIYAYRCSSCGHAKDVLQKMSDVPLSDCPACGASTFSKQVTAAGFQLKGSGWYVTDFRGSNSGASPAASVDDKSVVASASTTGDLSPSTTTSASSTASNTAATVATSASSMASPSIAASS